MKRSSDQPDVPVCHHLIPTKSAVVRKEGPNKGKRFYMCTKGRDDSNRCDFFMFDDEFQDMLSNGYTIPEAELPDKPDHIVTEEEFLKDLQLTEEECKQVVSADQRTDLWYKSRKHRITASNYGAAVGLHKYCNRTELVRRMLWSHIFQGNENTAWGTEKEPVACEEYEQYMRTVKGRPKLYVEETGLHIKPANPWIGVSPDGLVHDVDDDGSDMLWLLEIKCPWSLKNRKKGEGDFYPVVDLPYGDKEGAPNGRTGPIPPYYYCQIQGVMGILNLPYADFAVWTPEELQVTRFQFDKRFFDEYLYPNLKDFYFHHYVPAALDYLNHRLQPGNVFVEWFN